MLYLRNKDIEDIPREKETYQTLDLLKKTKVLED